MANRKYLHPPGPRLGGCERKNSLQLRGLEKQQRGEIARFQLWQETEEAVQEIKEQRKINLSLCSLGNEDIETSL